VPPWDFDASGADAQIKDTAAAAIVAGALIELGRIHPEAQAGTEWAARGHAMLEALCRDEFARESVHRGLLKHSCYSKPHGIGVDSATMFGDYFFIEALCRAAMPGALLPQHAVEF
jgi:unsaturated chondroitin disaccharide hydrolase